MTDDIENGSSDGKKQSFMLTNADIQRLIKDPEHTKVEVTEKLAKYYSEGGFDVEQMALVSDIFRTLVKDTEVSVRKVLAEAIKDAKDAPADVILQLANDIQEISVPVLEFSEVISDEDLMEIIQSTTDSVKQSAVAKRKTVSEPLSTALIETKNDTVVDSLLQNEGAQVSEDGYNKIVNTFADREDILGAMINRDKLPTSVIEYLSTAVSDSIMGQLEKKHGNAFKKISPMLSKSREIVTAKAFGLQVSESEYYKFLHHMEVLNTPDEMISIYALTMGNLKIFEMFVARIMRVPIGNVRTLIKDRSNKGMMAICKSVKMPDEFHEVVCMLADVLRDLEGKLKGNGIYLSAVSSQEMIDQLKAMVNGEVDKVPNLDYVIQIIEYNKRYDRED